jgi:hypothetical protein
MPGFLTGIAAIITASIGAYAVFHHPIPTAVLFVNPNTIEKGQSSTLTWQTTDATVVNVEEIGPVAPNSSQKVTPDSSIVYHLTATGAGGTQKATAQLSVTAPDGPSRPVPNVLYGDWQGVLQAATMGIVLHINLGGASTDGYGNPTTVTVNGKDVQLSIPSVAVSFHGTLQDATINGTFSQRGTNVALVLMRMSGGGDGINGDWQGTLTFPSIPLVLHIKPGGGSTCDTPTQGYFGVPMNVTTDGTNFQFEVPVAGMRFSGSVEGREIKGIFSQNGGSQPLKFLKQ